MEDKADGAGQAGGNDETEAAATTHALHHGPPSEEEVQNHDGKEARIPSQSGQAVKGPCGAPTPDREADDMPDDKQPALSQHQLLRTTTASSDSADPEAMAGDSASALPRTGPPMCEGDTTLTENFLPSALAAGLFERLCAEVDFQQMTHLGGVVPRFVAVQGFVAPDGTQPVYRHPADAAPPLAAFTPAVQLVRACVERALAHPVNHALIQCYRGGDDHISEHSDKTLDVVRGSYIANVSIGAARTMVFRSKRGERSAAAAADDMDGHAASGTPPPKPEPKRRTTRCAMPHNSLIQMGLLTNERWLHGIKPDKRPAADKSAAERAWNGVRISLTFRHIGTFLSPPPAPRDGEPAPLLIWGQGATAKTRAHARPVRNGPPPEAAALLRAMGRENNAPAFDWAASYGRGSDVLHMGAAAPPRYSGRGGVEDGRVRIMLAERGVPHTCGGGVGEALPVRYEVDDADRTAVVGDVAILLFLDAKHPRKRASKGDAALAGVYSRLHAAIVLEQRWKGLLWGSAAPAAAAATAAAPKTTRCVFAALKPHLAELEQWAAEEAAGRRPDAAATTEASVADCALWPVLYDVAAAWKAAARGRGVGLTVFGYLGLPALDGYYRSFGGRNSVCTVFGEGALASVLPEPVSPEKDDDERKEEEEEEEFDVVEGVDRKLGHGKLPKLAH